MFERYSEPARRVIMLAVWSAQKRGAAYIEPEDLLHALIREDRREFAAAMVEMHPNQPRIEQPAEDRRPFFTDTVAQSLIQELHEQPVLLTAEPPGGRLEPVPHVDLPVSRDLKHILTVAASDTVSKIIQPLHLLAAIVEDRDSRLAQLLWQHGITRQKVAEALNTGTDRKRSA
jgi:ATP-dependent Clp protease ATP-binding subunit ClpA